MTLPIIEFQNVSYQYAAAPVLENLTIHLHKGQFVGILGPSGAGKTTLLKLVLGLLTPTHGTIKINGELMRHAPSRRVAYVPQVESVDWNFPLTVEQAVLMGRTRQSSPWPWSSRHERETAAKVMERLGISALAKRHIRELSGGQQQRVFLARALLAEPDLLVLDEPTAGVDMRTQEDVLHLLADLNSEGITILMTTHDLNAAASHLPWVVCLNRTIIAQGTPDQIFVPETLNATYQGDMIVVRQNGLIFVQERPHGHSVQDLIPDPILSHAPHPLPKAAQSPDMAVPAANYPEASNGSATRAV